MGIAEQAAAAGFTHVQTAGGPVPVEQFYLRDALGMKFDADAACFFGPWRPATTFEVMHWEAKGHPPMIGLQGRDRWPLVCIEKAEA